MLFLALTKLRVEEVEDLFELVGEEAGEELEIDNEAVVEEDFKASATPLRVDKTKFCSNAFW